MSDLPGVKPIASATHDEPDWTDQVTDLIVDTVDRIHDAATGPLVSAAKGAIYGTVAGLVGSVVLVLGTILTIRSLDLLPGNIWLPYSVLGVVLTALGLVLWGKRTDPSESS